MATKWISLCDLCGREEVGGDDKATSFLGIPQQPASAFFRFTSERGGEDEQRLDLDLCGPCGGRVMGELREIFPEKYWNAEDDAD
jgi:hypothetical protein